MQRSHFTTRLTTAVVGTLVLLLGATLAVAQQVNLTAGPSSTILPDGTSVPMWGYTCGAPVSGSTATCGKLNPASIGWSPVLITVPTGTNLQINLTNNLSFGTDPNINNIPTSLVIVGQLGGGLGNSATYKDGPQHVSQPTSWPIADTGPVFTPPPQGQRVQSFSTEVAATPTTTAQTPTSLTWNAPRPGTYLLESGTHPSIQGPMGLYGIVVVTAAPASGAAGTAYPAAGSTPAVKYNAEIPMLLSEIDPIQNTAVSKAVAAAGFQETATNAMALKPGPITSTNVYDGGSGYTTATVSFSPTGATGTVDIDTDPTSPTYKQVTGIEITSGGTYTSDPTVIISSVDGTGAKATASLSLGNAMAQCSGGAAACYPPAVNYTPLYYLINGQAFNKTNAGYSLFAASQGSNMGTVAGNVLVRMVNAGLRMHVPSIVGSQTGSASPASSGFSLIAEDGNPLPGVPRVQNEVFMAAGKTYDVMINVPASGGTALPIFDRQLSLSGNSTARDAGMLAYISVNGAGLPAANALGSAQANPDTYNSIIPGKTLTISDLTKGVIANDVNIFGVQATTLPLQGTLTLNTNGTFTYVAFGTWMGSDTFTYCGNGATTGPACATVTLNAAPIEAGNGILMSDISYTSKVATVLSIKPPGILSVDKDSAGYPITVASSTVAPGPINGIGPCSSPAIAPCVSVDANGGFNAIVSTPNTYTFTYKAQNSQGTPSTNSATVTLNFPAGSGLQVTVVDGSDKTTQLKDYRWIIEEDRTFYIDPNNTTNNSGGVPPTFGVNFHTSYMPVVATGCTGPNGAIACETGQTLLGQPAVCDVGNGVCRTDAAQQTAVDPSQVVLDPKKRYYISVLPGDAATPFNTGNGQGGHGMGGAPIAAGQTSVKILVEPTPFQTAKLSVFVFEDDFPLNGEQDAGGGVDVLAPNEPGLGGFNITLFDDAGGSGDATGQMTYDMFNMPLSNSLDGTIDPATGLNACPISQQAAGITGTIVTCPTYEADGVSLSPLAGQAVIANMMPGRYGVVATPAADRIARGEEWLQTNTLDGQKAHDSFLRVGEPSYFQEYGPAGYHVSIGFANPSIINNRLAAICTPAGDGNLQVANCNNTITGTVTTERMSRTPDERLYSSGSNDSFAFTQCYVSVGDPDGEDFAFTKCSGDGSFRLSGIPQGSWRITVFDQWNDMLVDGLSTPVYVGGANSTVLMGEIAMNQWQANIYTSTFFDQNGNGVRDGSEPGLTLVPTNIRFRDGSFSNFNNTDLSGNAGFNEVFPLFNWYVIETDSTRYKNTGTHVVYDAGGPADGSSACGASGAPPCGNSNIAKFMANTAESFSVPNALRVPGAVYCKGGDCSNESILNGLYFNPSGDSGLGGSTGRIDPPWVLSEGWQGYSGQNSFVEFGKKPFAAGENGGIRGHVIYASTRPFDDPQLLLQTSWEPLVPGVTINLYQEGTAPDGTQSLTLVDTTTTSSWDDWSQGFRSDGQPNLNCPGQGDSSSDLFFFSLYNQPNWLDAYNNGGTPAHPIPNNSQYKCYDGMHNWNQLQPAPYDGMYKFPSIAGRNPQSGAPTGGTGAVHGTNCTICTTNPNDGEPLLPNGKYVVEVVVPPGYELVKEEDKNILIGDNYIAPVTQEFGGLGNIFILPDQAAIGSTYNSNNAQNPTQDMGRSTLPSGEGDTGSVETFWPCVGASRIVPDYISLYPASAEVSPFAGATRNLCDRKEVTLDDQMTVLAKFYIFTSTHVAAHFTGVITDDFTSEFDPFSPSFGEKFAPPNLPISLKDFAGNEISRVYADHWGAYNGLTYSTWEVNPPNPTGYAPNMMVTCMNDPGTGPTPDPLYNPEYSQFCYEIPFMPGQTQYMDTPVVPTSAFAGAGYNNPDCNYPAATPAIKEVDGDAIGPWVQAAGNQLTITALGDQTVPNNAYSGPSATAAPYNQKTITRHYGFGAAQGTVTIGGQTATITNWSDSQITVNTPNNVPACGITQQTQYGGSAALCGQLLITAANGQQSIDTVTVTIGGKQPTHVLGSDTIQGKIDAASPGDLIIVDPGVHNEMVIMWKPVRLQGVGAASSVINANTHPAGKMDPWRRQVSCLFGIAVNGQPVGGSNAYDSTGTYTCPGAGWTNFSGVASSYDDPQVDRIPMEGIVGWDTSVNGNLAQLLQEPTLMGAYEGAGITVLAKGVNTHGAADYYGAGTNESAFPTGTTVLTAADCSSGQGGNNPYPSNFQCNPSSIDGLSITNSSQGGGGILVHGWGHNLQIANNRVTNNTGTLTGGITVGQGESPDAYLVGSATDSDPGSCQTGTVTNQQLPYCFDLNVNVHNNEVSYNSSIGDELFSSTPAGAGGVTFCTGADYYKFNYNWVCGNLSSGDGGGFAHLGFIWNGDIEHNSFLFNQSTNPTVPTNGGAIVVMGAPPDGVPAGAAAGAECGSTAADADCTPGLSDGTGPNLVINANLIQGNQAESGSGGGIRLQGINGTEIALFPSNSDNWNGVTVTNNIIANNVSGWDGAGMSLQDAMKVSIINNTIVSNDSTGSAGVLFNTLGAPLSSSGGSGGNPTTSSTTSAPQIAGVAVTGHSPQLLSALNGLSITCPTNNPNCTQISFPYLANDIIWQNRSFYIGVGSLGTGTTNQQNVVALYNAFTSTQAPSQPQGAATGANGSGVIITGGTGACPSPASYWDIGVRGDAGPGTHESTFTLAPQYSVLTDAADYPSGNNLASNPTVNSQYCNGSRVPPELGSSGYQVPPGISDATVPNPIFNLTPAATVDEGNNWINISWGPLSLSTPNGSTLGNYSLALSSPAIDYVPSSSPTFAVAPTTDFFGNQRPDPAVPTAIDVGAVETQVTPTLASINPTSGYQGYSVPVTLTGSYLGGTTAINAGAGITATSIHIVNSSTVTATLNISASATLGAHQVTISEGTATTNSVTFTVTQPPPPTVSSISPTFGYRNSSVAVTLTGTFLTAGGVSLSGTGVTVSNVNTSSDGTQLTATFAINSTATLGGQSVTVTTPGGTTSAGTFTVLGAPTLTSISPNTGSRGSSTPVTLTGTNLNGVTSITVSGTGVTVSNLVVSSGTQVTATLTIANNATISNRTVHVNTAGGASNNVTFSVTSVPTPTLTSISPNTGARATSVPVTLTGTNLTGASAVSVSGSGVTVTSFTVNSSTQISATFSISGTATLTTRNVTVTTGGGTSNSVTFTPVGPSLTSITPNSGVRGSSVPVTLAGTNLTGATSISAGNGITVSGLTVGGGGSQITATFTISSSSTTGAHNVTVSTPGGTTNAVTFTVQGPTLSSISPTFGSQGTSVAVILNGTNLGNATGLTNLSNGLSLAAGSFHVVNSTQVTATINISSTAAAIQRTIGVTTSIGTTNTVAFTVQVPPAPTLTSITPSSATRPATGTLNVPVTLTGTNFTATGSSVAVSGTGVTIVNGSTVVVNSTTINVTLRITSSANTTTPRNITVNTPGGGSNPVTFTVN